MNDKDVGRAIDKLAAVPGPMDDTEIVHVYPVNDLVPHITDSIDDCPCQPRVEYVDGGYVVTHHSLDGREQKERDQEER